MHYAKQPVAEYDIAEHIRPVYDSIQRASMFFYIKNTVSDPVILPPVITPVRMFPDVRRCLMRKLRIRNDQKPGVPVDPQGIPTLSTNSLSITIPQKEATSQAKGRSAFSPV